VCSRVGDARACGDAGADGVCSCGGDAGACGDAGAGGGDCGAGGICSRGGDAEAYGDVGASGVDCGAGGVWSCGGDAGASSVCFGAAPSCCATDDEGCSIKTCASMLRSGDTEGCGPSHSISHLCHRMVEPRHSPRQYFPSTVGTNGYTIYRVWLCCGRSNTALSTCRIHLGQYRRGYHHHLLLPHLLRRVNP
jgi:hypothetical protein